MNGVAVASATYGSDIAARTIAKCKGDWGGKSVGSEDRHSEPKTPRRVHEPLAPRRGPYLSSAGESAFDVRIEWGSLLKEFPAALPGALDDDQFRGRIRIALAGYRSARYTHIARKRFRNVAKAIERKAAALREELLVASDLTSANASVLHRVDEISGRPISTFVAQQLATLCEALNKARELEPERGALRDEPARLLIYELSEIFIDRTGKRPSREFEQSIADARADLADRPQRERELGGNEFARFVLLIERAYLEGERRRINKETEKGANAAADDGSEFYNASLGFGQIRQNIISIVDQRRRAKWR